METTSGDGRFRDPGVRLWVFADEILVRCPRCDGRAVVVVHQAHREDQRHLLPLIAPHRLTCPACGHTDEWTVHRERNYAVVPPLSGPNDPFFGRPLWLQRTCCGGRTLWAYNKSHLELLESYVAARLRERGEATGSGSLLEHLPAWIKAASNRAEILKTISTMRATC